jgi:predicted nucleotidyltransferase
LKDMTIEVDLREIKNLLSELNKKIDVLIEEKETLALMALAEKSLKDFLGKEPDIYTVEDIKAKVSYT